MDFISGKSLFNSLDTFLCLKHQLCSQHYQLSNCIYSKLPSGADWAECEWCVYKSMIYCPSQPMWDRWPDNSTLHINVIFLHAQWHVYYIFKITSSSYLLSSNTFIMNTEMKQGPYQYDGRILPIIPTIHWLKNINILASSMLTMKVRARERGKKVWRKEGKETYETTSFIHKIYKNISPLTFLYIDPRGSYTWLVQGV